MQGLRILKCFVLVLFSGEVFSADDKDWVYVKPVQLERANISFGSGITDNQTKQSMRNRILMNLTLQVVTSEDGYHEIEHILGWYDEGKQRFFPKPDSGDAYTYYCNDQVIGSFELLKNCLVQDWFRIERKYLLSEENRLVDGARFFSAKLPKRGKRIKKKTP